MKYLVDTHIFLWALMSPKNIPKRIKKILLDPESETYVSAITFWEISLKYQLGKLELRGILPDSLPQVARDTHFEIIPLDVAVASSFYKLPKQRNHDPFDRMLAWQAISRQYTLLTKDPDFAFYKESGLTIVD